MINATELYIWIVVWVTFTFVQSHIRSKPQGHEKQKNIHATYLTWYSIDMELRLTQLQTELKWLVAQL